MLELNSDWFVRTLELSPTIDFIIFVILRRVNLTEVSQFNIVTFLAVL